MKLPMRLSSKVLAAAGVFAAATLTARAAPLPLAETPLFLGSTSEPNILLQVDDSGSMDWQIIVPVSGTDGIIDGGSGSVGDFDNDAGFSGTPSYDFSYLFDLPNNNTNASPGLTNANGAVNNSAIVIDEVFHYDVTNPNYRRPTTSGNSCQSSTTTPSPPRYRPAGQPIGGFWRVWNSTYNGLAYNPNVRYSPWSGNDSAGTAFGNANPAAVRLDPWNATSATYNLTIPQRVRTQYRYICHSDTSATSPVRHKGLNQTRFIGNEAGGVPDSRNDFDGTVYGNNVNNLNLDGGANTTSGTGTAAGDYDSTAERQIHFNNREALWIYPARYYTWTDSNSNGVVDPTDAHQLIEIRTTSDSDCLPQTYAIGTPGSPVNGARGCTAPALFSSSVDATLARAATRTDCAVNAGTGVRECTAAQELQNYANWFQYYNRRISTAKAAFGAVAFRTFNTRMGLVTLHNNGGNSNTAIRYMNPDPAAGNKRSLLNAIYRMDPANGTPLQREMTKAGRYLDCSDTTNSYSFSHTAANDDGDGDGVLDTLGAGCPAFTAARGGECQQNFLVHMTDGYYNTNATGDWPAADRPGNTDTDGAGPWDGGAYADTISNTLGDIAMFWYETDIQPALADNLPVVQGVDENRAQHVVTYTVSFGLNGLILPNSNVAGRVTGADGMPANRLAPFSWPDPQPTTANSIPEKIDDLRHAAFNGRGKFLSAKSPETLITALDDAVNSISERTSAASSVALNSGSLNTGTTVFQAKFNTGDWTGSLAAFPISSGGGQTPGCSLETIGQICPQIWDAAQVLKTQDWNTGRNIITMTTTARRGGVPFRWANLDAATEQFFLNYNSDSNAQDTLGPSRLNYIRGDRSLEGGNLTDFRQRSTPLGDLINSDPFFVGKPASGFDQLAGYTAFRSANSTRTPMVWVGGNDGMMHGFQASNGVERLAFVPGERGIYEDLSRLVSQAYNGAHRYFVDGSPEISDAKIGADWKTVLVSGLRSGGQGLFALDITDPANFSEANASTIALWQFTDLDDADLGYTYARPAIRLMSNGKFAAIVGNGYNSSKGTYGSRPQTDSNVGTGLACLFIIFMDGPSGNTWTNGTNYKKICTTAGSSGTPNGLASAAAADLNGDLVTDAIYAGDLEGNLWKFDVRDPSPANWRVAYGGAPLARACSGDPCTTSNRQPITARPEVGPHPDQSPMANGQMVFFGTGRYIASGDNSASGQQTQTFYAIYDQSWGSATSTPATPPALPITKTSLAQQEVLRERASSGSGCTGADCLRVISNNPVNLRPTNGVPDDQGWYLDLVNTENNNNKGERQVTNPVLRDDRIVFTTLLPSTDRCSFGGKGWLMELAFGTGGALEDENGDPESPFDTNNDGVINEDDLVGGSGGDAAGGQMADGGIIPEPTILALPPGTCMENKYLSTAAGNIGVTGESAECQGRANWRQVR